MSYQYHLLDHPADIRLEVEANSLEELFLGAVEGMALILYSDFKNLQNNKKIIKQKINLSSLNQETLLIDFLNKILTLSDIEGAVFPVATIQKLTDNKIEAEITGYPVERFDKEIKAVTYHQLKIEKTKEKMLKTTILFDV